MENIVLIRIEAMKLSIAMAGGNSILQNDCMKLMENTDIIFKYLVEGKWKRNISLEDNVEDNTVNSKY